MAEIAAAAGVSVETVYKAFGNKPGLVKAVFDVLVVGDDDDVPMMQREFVQRNIAEPDPRASSATTATTSPRWRRASARSCSWSEPRPSPMQARPTCGHSYRSSA